MNDVDRLLCEKMRTAGCQVAFKSADSGWVFIRSASEDSEEKRAKMYAEGVGIEHFDGCAIYYFCDDWEFKESCFYPKKDVVKSVPVAVTDFDSPIFKVLTRGLSSYASVIDLTDFCGVVAGAFLSAYTVIIGNDVRFFGAGAPSAVSVAGDSYMDLLLGDRDLRNVDVDANDLVVVGSEPITNLSYTFKGATISSLDMSKTDLSECEGFTDFCRGCVYLHSIKIGDIPEGAQCFGAFNNTGLPSEFNEYTFRNNKFRDMACGDSNVFDELRG